jgi:hypothetical protein
MSIPNTLKGAICRLDSNIPRCRTQTHIGRWMFTRPEQIDEVQWDKYNRRVSGQQEEGSSNRPRAFPRKRSLWEGE